MTIKDVRSAKGAGQEVEIMSIDRLKRFINTVFLISFLILAAYSAASAQNGDTAKQATPEEIASMIQTLKDPAARDHLIRQLEILTLAQEPPEHEKAVRGAMAQILQGISGRVKTFSHAVLEISGGINRFPDLAIWVKLQFTDAQARTFWGEVLTRVGLVLGLGLLVYFLSRFLLRHPRRSLAGQSQENFTMRFFRLLGVLMLDLLPILAFTLTAYAVLGIVDPREKTRLVVLAWVNAFIIVRLTFAIFSFILSPAFPHLRIPVIRDETAHYLDIWVHRITRIAVYGYFGLQAAVFLGLPSATYESLLRLLGLVVTVLTIILIMQNRTPVADFIRGRKPEADAREGSRHLLLNRIAQAWHLLATLYVLLLYGVWFFQIEGGFLFLLKATVITIAVLLIGRTALGFINTLFRHGFKVKDDLKVRFPALELRANRYLSTVKKFLRAIVWFLMALAVFHAWGQDALGWLSSEPGRVLLSTVATVIAIIVVTVIIWEIFNSLIAVYLSERDEQGAIIQSARDRTLQAVARKALLVFLIIVSGMMILSELGVNIGPLLAGAGVLGLAIGFGAQKFVQDVVTGIFILFENQIAVDDVVNVADKGGLVEAVSIRSVRLRDYSGTVHMIPFSSISTVSNMTKDFSFYVFEVGVAYREDIDEVITVLRGIGAELQEDSAFGLFIKEPLDVAGLDSFGDSAVVIKARLKTVPLKQWMIGREFNRRMKKKFDELGIEIPFPHRTIYMGEDKEGKAPPLTVALKKEGSGHGEQSEDH